MPEPTVALKDPRKAALLAWMVPGLGHWYQGRRGKAALYFVCIVGLYVWGLALGEWKVVYWRWLNPLADSENFTFAYLAQFWVGLLALPGLIQATLVRYGFGPILGGFLAEPPMNAINALHPKLGKLVEVGRVYTIVAGLLNVLAIYDAAEGPAHLDDPSEESPAPAPAEAASAPASAPDPAPAGEPVTAEGRA